MISTLWLFNIAMEIGPFIVGLPINSMVIFHGYVSHNQMVHVRKKQQKTDTWPHSDDKKVINLFKPLDFHGFSVNFFWHKST